MFSTKAGACKTCPAFFLFKLSIALTSAFEALTMFGHPATHAGTPAPKATRLQLAAHYPNNIGFAQTRAFANLLKRATICPCHRNH